MSCSTTVVSLKECFEFHIFDTVSYSIECTFSLNKKHGVYIFKALHYFSSFIEGLHKLFLPGLLSGNKMS